MVEPKTVATAPKLGDVLKVVTEATPNVSPEKVNYYLLVKSTDSKFMTIDIGTSLPAFYFSTNTTIDAVIAEIKKNTKIKSISFYEGNDAELLCSGVPITVFTKPS